MSSISTSSRQPTGLGKRQHLPSKVPTSSTNSRLKPTKNNYVDLKIVIRLLPSNLSEEEFYEQLKVYHPSELPVKYYVQGEAPRTPYDNPKYSRAYIKFRNAHELDEFLGNVRGKPFVETESGDSVIPTVEKSLYNKMPEVERKRTKKSSSLDDDPLFKAFTIHLEGPSVPFSILGAKNANKNRRKRSDRNKKKNKDVDPKKEVEKVKDDGEVKTKPKRVRKKKDNEKKDKGDDKQEKNDENKEIKEIVKKDGDASNDKLDAPKKRRRRRPKKEEIGESKTNETKSNKPQDSTTLEKKTSEKPKKDISDSKRVNKTKNKSLRPKKGIEGSEPAAS